MTKTTTEATSTMILRFSFDAAVLGAFYISACARLELEIQSRRGLLGQDRVGRMPNIGTWPG